MRIVYLHQYFMTPDQGGGTRSYEMARRLVRAGHEVDVISADMTGSVSYSGWSVSTVEGVTVHRLYSPYSNETPFRQRIVAFARFAFSASCKAVQLRSDLVFATSTPLTIAIPGLITKWTRRVPLVLEVRDLWPTVPIALGALNNRVAIWCARILEHVAYRQSRSIIALSPQMRDGIVERGVSSNRVFIVPNSCDFDLFDVPSERGDRLRQQFHWLEERPLVIYAGTLGKANGVRWVVDLAKALSKIDSDVRVAIIGIGMEKELIEDHARDLGVLNTSLFLVGSKAKLEVVDWFSAANFSISSFIDLPELHANSSNKFFDSLASGTPVLLNHGGWHADLVNERGIGLALDRYDIDGSARRIVEHIRDSEIMLDMAQNAREAGRELYDRNVLADKFTKILTGAAPRPTD